MLFLRVILKETGFQVQIGTVDASGDQSHSAQRTLDVVPHPGCRGGRHGQDRRLAQFSPRLCDEQIVRTKVVAPQANAVRFVHDQQRDPSPFQGVQEGPLAQALRCGIQEFVLASRCAGQSIRQFEPIDRAVQGCRLGSYFPR